MDNTDQKYFWRLIITEDGKDHTSAEGKADTLVIAVRMLKMALETFYLFQWPKIDAHTVEVKTILEKVYGMEP